MRSNIFLNAHRIKFRFWYCYGIIGKEVRNSLQEKLITCDKMPSIILVGFLYWRYESRYIDTFPFQIVFKNQIYVTGQTPESRVKATQLVFTVVEYFNKMILNNTINSQQLKIYNLKKKLSGNVRQKTI